MTTVRGILVKQFGGPEVLEYVNNIAQPLKPAARQVFAFAVVSPCFDNSHTFIFMFIYRKNVNIIRTISTLKIA